MLVLVPARIAAQRATIAFLGAVFHNAAAELQSTLATLAAAGDAVRSDPLPSGSS